MPRSDDDLHRRQYHLDGPNDYDFIMPNWLISEREDALYVDLIEHEGELAWSSPFEQMRPAPIPKSVYLALALQQIGAASTAGLNLMSDIWRDFDPEVPSHHTSWVARNRQFVEALAPTADGGGLATAAQLVIREWPMPMVNIHVELDEVDLEDLRAERAVRLRSVGM